MKLSQIDSYWNRYLSEWDNSPFGKAMSEKAARRFFHKSSLLNAGISYMPEPYYGDINNPYCVIINLNPGLSHPMDWVKQHSSGGFIYNDLHNGSYSVVNQKYSPFLPSSITSIGTPKAIPGADWWNENRMKWINSFLHRLYGSHIPDLAQPLALELCPWHSVKWGRGIVEGMGSFLFDTVLEPAADAIGPNRFGFCFGKEVGEILIDNGFLVVQQWDKDSSPNTWPLGQKGNKVNRTYRLLGGVVKGKKVLFLNHYAYGSFKTPGRAFAENVEPQIIRDLHAMGFK